MDELVRYYFKPPTKYPARIYILYGFWPQRNLRPMGIMTQPCLYSRRAQGFEIDEITNATRMLARQFEAKDVNHMIWLHVEDGFSNEQIQTILDEVIPLHQHAFRQHLPIAEIRRQFDSGARSVTLPGMQFKLF
ncbi:hypothetical protein FAES_4054 [Fibrella aestuarina BUZ 2]|uniref:Uncharacterized protein n=1 Tax=Fibrella aestuarina BUZ 2 TaxID=1166018 RepID=I0KD51_9BACT|nr:hypothetical protein [Fibrella aestuarina]CCH02054.1 hypothetical protein FAES_4054 [Fibrella aestuarina BUZ 2]